MKKTKEQFMEETKRRRVGDKFLRTLARTQEQAMYLSEGEVKVVSVFGVPDLTWKGYRYPEVTRQFIVTLNVAMDKKEFAEKMRSLF